MMLTPEIRTVDRNECVWSLQFLVLLKTATKNLVQKLEGSFKFMNDQK